LCSRVRRRMSGRGWPRSCWGRGCHGGSPDFPLPCSCWGSSHHSCTQRTPASPCLEFLEEEIGPGQDFIGRKQQFTLNSCLFTCIRSLNDYSWTCLNLYPAVACFSWPGVLLLTKMPIFEPLIRRPPAKSSQRIVYFISEINIWSF